MRLIKEELYVHTTTSSSRVSITMNTTLKISKEACRGLANFEVHYYFKNPRSQSYELLVEVEIGGELIALKERETTIVETGSDVEISLRYKFFDAANFTNLDIVDSLIFHIKPIENSTTSANFGKNPKANLNNPNNPNYMASSLLVGGPIDYSPYTIPLKVKAIVLSREQAEVAKRVCLIYFL